jgi:hypothetical protein
MTPILGIIASQITGHLSTNSYESIATVNAGGSSSITFSSIPSTFKNIQIRANASSGGPYGKLTFNGDTTANYRDHYLIGNGGGTAQSGSQGTGYNSILIASNNGFGTSTSFTGMVMDILDYTSTVKNKTVRTLMGFDANGSGEIGLYSGIWFATPAAITSLTITLSSGTFLTNSTFALYGVKG